MWFARRFIVSCGVLYRRPLRNHRRSEHAWFYNDMKLYNNNNNNNDKNDVGVAANGSVVYTLSQLVDKLNDTNVVFGF